MDRLPPPDMFIDGLLDLGGGPTPWRDSGRLITFPADHSNLRIEETPSGLVFESLSIADVEKHGGRLVIIAPHYGREGLEELQLTTNNGTHLKPRIPQHRAEDIGLNVLVADLARAGKRAAFHGSLRFSVVAHRFTRLFSNAAVHEHLAVPVQTPDGESIPALTDSHSPLRKKGLEYHRKFWASVQQQAQYATAPLVSLDTFTPEGLPGETAPRDMAICLVAKENSLDTARRLHLELTRHLRPHLARLRQQTGHAIGIEPIAINNPYGTSMHDRLMCDLTLDVRHDLVTNEFSRKIMVRVIQKALNAVFGPEPLMGPILSGHSQPKSAWGLAL